MQHNWVVAEWSDTPHGVECLGCHIGASALDANFLADVMAALETRLPCEPGATDERKAELMAGFSADA